MAVKATINRVDKSLHCSEFVEDPNKVGAAISISTAGVITSKGPLTEAQGNVSFAADAVNVEELFEDID